MYFFSIEKKGKCIIPDLLILESILAAYVGILWKHFLSSSSLRNTSSTVCCNDTQMLASLFC